jgi:serine/threonine protein kinase
MNSEEIIFAAAAELPLEQRGAYLDEACAGQPELRARVEMLLRSHDDTGFMADHSGWTNCPPVGEQKGGRIGHYKLLEQIGEGGFGTVWVAEQEQPVRRRVALKIIKPGMDSREVIARFEQERQALAMMDHPAIAKVFDAGATEKGRPYFVMELVRGMKITAYCDEAKLPTADRLRLFITVCQAVQHAHQKGIIHRDLKPSNILVTPGDDGLPLPKVIDFGLAKAMQQSLTEDTVYTQFEQMIGTPAYMSPEQIGLGPMDIDTRSDVYSLGVLLYELLTGKPPFDSKQLLNAGIEEMRRVIREMEPPKPSTRRTQLRTGSAAAEHPGRSTFKNLKSKIATDLDWIVMKAIEKDRRRRYETANGLARDIQRFLANEPVSASPPTAIYRMRKFARRNKAAILVSSTIAATLMAATIVSVRQAESPA